MMQSTHESGKTALIVGASGLIGGELLELMLKSNEYVSIHLWLRSTLPVSDARVQQHLVDFHHLERTLLPNAVDDVFCCLGTTIKKAGSQEQFRKVDVDWPLAIASLMQLRGMKQFLIVTAIGANQHSSIFYSRMKGMLEQQLIALNIPQLYIFRPSLLLGVRREHRPGERLAIQIDRWLRVLMIGPLSKYRGIPARTVAACMLQRAIQINSHPQKVTVCENEEMLLTAFSR
jgi:uncharacterized protein YbjT (DUF2867 family)